ncbi:MAG: YciI family protein [Geminicoccaceae bacterium]
MPFAIMALDKPGSGSVRTENRPAHLEHLDRYAARLLAGGAVLADDAATPVGSLIVYDSEDRAEVEAFLAADPFTKAGLFASVSIYPWRKVFFGGRR